MADQIAVTGIRGTGFHGVFEHERREGQEFSVDVRLDVSTAAAAGSDDLGDTVDYGQVAVAVHALIVGEPVDLVETLAERPGGGLDTGGVAMPGNGAPLGRSGCTNRRATIGPVARGRVIRDASRVFRFRTTNTFF